MLVNLPHTKSTQDLKVGDIHGIVETTKIRCFRGFVFNKKYINIINLYINFIYLMDFVFHNFLVC